MEDRFSLQFLFSDFCLALAEHYEIHRAGIVRTNLVDDEFTLIAQWFADRPGQPARERSFDRADTVGDWVLRQRQSFVGSSIEDVAAFPSTLLDFQDEGLQSNFVGFVDWERLILFFAVSRSKDAFREPQLLQQKLSVLPHCVALAEQWQSPGLEEAMQSRLEALVFGLWERYGGVPSQQQLDRAYYQALLGLTGGRIDGPQGAAALAGLKASTLRSRIERANRKPEERQRP
jgi:hypothetical protein